MNEWKKRLTLARNAKFPKKIDFARAVGVSTATTTDWEKDAADGGIKELTGPNLVKVCSVLGIAPSWLLHGKTPEIPEDQPFSETTSIQWVSEDEAELLKSYRAADFEGRRLLRVMAENVTKR